MEKLINRMTTYSKEVVFEETLKYFKGDTLATDVWIKKYALKDSKGNLYEKSPEDMHRRIAKELARIESKYPNPLSEEEIFEYIKEFKYLIPGGSSSAGIGNDFVITSLSNCFVIGNDEKTDSYGGIMRIDEEIVQLSKRRGGVGTDISYIRPAGTSVKNSALTSTGIVPFMERYSNSIREVAQNGRRGALMISCDIEHPESENFMDAKMEQGKVTGANISLKIGDNFMESVKGDGKFTQSYPIGSKTPSVTKVIDSKKLFDKLIHNAWKSAEPGCLFWGTIIKESIPDCYADLGFKSISTNPCFPASEYLLTDKGYIKFGKLYEDGTNNIVVCDSRISYNNDGEEKASNWVIDNDKYGTINREGSHVFMTKKDAEIIEIVTSKGFSIKCTPDHHIATKTGMVEAKDLTQDHEILISIPNNDGSIINMTPSNELEHLAMLIGLITGDGCSYKGTSNVNLDFWGDDKERMKEMVLNSIDFLYERYGDICGDNGKKLKKYFFSKKETVIKYNKIRITSAWLGKLLESFGFIRTNKLDIPEFIMNNSSTNIGKFYLAGLFYTDGSVQGNKEKGYSIRLSQSDTNLLKKVQIMLHSNGIISGLYKRRDERMTLLPDGKFGHKYYLTKPQYELITLGGSIVKYRDSIGFLGHKEKEEKMNVTHNFYIKKSFSDTLVEVIKHNNEPVFCIKEDVGRNIIVNGISARRCGEIVLCDSDSCRLLSINLYSFVENPFTKEAKFNFDKFKKTVQVGERFMDDIVDLEIEKIDKILAKIDSDPESESIKSVEKNLWVRIKDKTIRGRRTGMGITAEGDMLAALGLTYGTGEATEFSVLVHKMLAINAYKSSCYMAQERGSFPIYDYNREINNPFIKRLCENDNELEELLKKGRRNIALLTIAPNGTLSMLTQTTSGIEPVFLPVYKRRRKINPTDVGKIKVDFIDELGDKWEEYVVIHHKFLDYLTINGFDVANLKNLSETELNELVKNSPYNKATSADVDWLEKVRMQGAIQKWVDHSISVTVNLPENTSEDVVRDLYLNAYECGCKGVTIYREGSRSGVLISDKKKEDVHKHSISETHAPKRPKRLECDVLRFNNNHEKWIGFTGVFGDDKKPYEIFTGLLESFTIPAYVEKGWIVKDKETGISRYDFNYIDKDGYEQSIKGLNRAFNPAYWNYARLISGVLRHGMPIPYVCDLVEGLNFEDALAVNSWKVGIKRMLKKYIKDGTEVTGQKCPDCGNTKLKFQDGCVSCDCGYSKCG